MGTDETYNGWTNRETWAVALHVNNDQGWQEDVHSILRSIKEARGEDMDARMAGDYIREQVEETLDADLRVGSHGTWVALTEGQWGALQDIGSLWRVNWTELGASFLDDIKEG